MTENYIRQKLLMLNILSYIFFPPSLMAEDVKDHHTHSGNDFIEKENMNHKVTPDLENDKYKSPKACSVNKPGTTCQSH